MQDVALERASGRVTLRGADLPGVQVFGIVKVIGA